jgi:hypothetical protein
MAFNSAQVVVSSTLATPLIVAGTGPNQFRNPAGVISDPLPLVILNTDAAISVYLGGPNVSATNGLTLGAGQSVTLQIVDGATPYGLAASGSPRVGILAGRQ